MKIRSIFILCTFILFSFNYALSVTAEDTITLKGTFVATAHDTHFHPIAGKLVVDADQEYIIEKNEVAVQIFHLNEGTKIQVTGVVREEGDGKKITVHDFKEVDD